MRAIVITWDGTHLPEELKQLPPGRYLVEPVENIENLEDLTPEEEAGIRLAMDQIDAGQGVPLEEAIRQIRSRVRAR